MGIDNLPKEVPFALSAGKLNVNVLPIGSMVSVTSGSLLMDWARVVAWSTLSGPHFQDGPRGMHQLQEGNANFARRCVEPRGSRIGCPQAGIQWKGREGQGRKGWSSEWELPVVFVGERGRRWEPWLGVMGGLEMVRLKW